MFNLLATEEDDDRRIQLLRKHCTLKSKMDELKKERAEQNKKKKLLTAALRLAQRRKKRIVGKACTLSEADIVQILCLENEQRGKKTAKMNATGEGKQE